MAGEEASSGYLGQPYLLADKNKEKLNSFDIFDKVINLRFFTAKKTADTIENSSATPEINNIFVLRSDFEPVFFDASYTDLAFGDTNGRRYFIRKCIHKPSIKVEYKLVAQKTQIALDIYIDNFFMLSSDGTKLTSFNIKDNPISRVQIMMGYFGQFNSLPHDTLTDLFQFQDGNGIDIITATVKTAYMDKNPPDGRLHLSCFLGQSSAINTNEYNLEVTEPDFVVKSPEGKPLRDIVKISYDSIKNAVVEAPISSSYSGIESYAKKGTDFVKSTPRSISGGPIEKSLAWLGNITSEKIAQLKELFSDTAVDKAIQYANKNVGKAPPVQEQFDATVKALKLDGKLGLMSAPVTNTSFGSLAPNMSSSLVAGSDLGFTFHFTDIDSAVDEAVEESTTSVGNAVNEIAGAYINESDLYKLISAYANRKFVPSQHILQEEIVVPKEPSAFVKFFVDTYNSIISAMKNSRQEVLARWNKDRGMSKDFLVLQQTLGAKVILSDSVKKIYNDIISSTNETAKKKEIMALCDDISALEKDINKCFLAFGENVRYTYTVDGYIFVYSGNEAQDLAYLARYFNATERGGMYINNSEYSAKFNNVIPAVYSINYDALCTVRCPFFSFVNPFQQLFFSNRYVTGSLVQYYTNPDLSAKALYVIQGTISFATVDDDNEMNLTCISAPEGTEAEGTLSQLATALDGFIEYTES